MLKVGSTGRPRRGFKLTAGGGSNLVTDYPQFLSHTNATETGNSTTGFTYTGSGTGDSDMGSTGGKGILLSQNGRFECTVKTLLLFNAFLAQTSDTAVGLAAAALYGGNVNASTYKTVIAGTANGAVNRGSGLNVGSAFPATDSDVLILEFIGTKALLKLRPTGTSSEYVLHSFGTARSGTLYVGAKFFNVGEVLATFTRIIGNPYRPWTTSANAIISAGNSFFDPASNTEFIGQIQDAYPICGNDTTFTNLGVVGATWADIQANQLAGANAAYTAAGARTKHILFSENSNTVVQQGLNAANTITAAKACIAAFLSGKTYATVGMMLQPPRAAGSTITNSATRVSQNQVIAAVQADMVANPAAYGITYFIDITAGVGNPFATVVAANYSDPSFAAVANYYQETGANLQIHPNAAGAWWPAQAYRTAILAQGNF